MKLFNGFSRLSREEKIVWIDQECPLRNEQPGIGILDLFRYPENTQKILDQLSENTLTNFPLPYGAIPNFLLNGKMHIVPMVTEESSVVAAAASGAKFWAQNGGLKARVIDTIKKGHVYFQSKYSFSELNSLFLLNKDRLLESVKNLTLNMEKRGGGVRELALLHVKDDFYKIEIDVCTCDAMGANFINTILENMGKNWKQTDPGNIDILMCILSNFTPECRVQAEACCDLDVIGARTAERMVNAYEMAKNDIYRAVTHNKGIFNGIDAVLMATGNDFRAAEAGAHAYASTFAGDNRYMPLSHYRICKEDNSFHISLELPLSVGVIGGITNTHPLSKLSLRILGGPNAKELMMIAAGIGLVQNFSAIRALIGEGIQKGHMKLHLFNILDQLGANEEERLKASAFFAKKDVSLNAVREFLQCEQKKGKDGKQ